MTGVKFMITHLASCKDRRVHSTMISALKKIGRMGVSLTQGYIAASSRCWIWKKRHFV